MGTFACLFRVKESRVPAEKRDELAMRMERLFQAAGMMEVEMAELYGTQIELLRKPTMHDYGIDVYYNYFDDSRWENAGFCPRTYSVWSEKIGGQCFCRAVLAAYVLEELYTEGICATIINSELVTSWIYVGWINYLFDEKYHIKNFDPWKLFECLHTSGETTDNRDGFDFGNSRYAFIGGCETCAVECGTERALQQYGRRAKGELERFALESMRAGKEAVQEYAQVSIVGKDEQLRQLMKLIRTYYMLTDEKIKPGKLFPGGTETLEPADAVCVKMMTALYRSDAPAFLIKVISEIYERDFWELWAEIKDIATRKKDFLYGNEAYYVVPISTAEMFKVSEDDLILYWEENSKITFSEELWNWFVTLKDRFDVIIAEELQMDKPLKYIVGLLKEAEEEYGRIYAFADFFEESLENLKDKRYQAYWKLFEELLRNSELKVAGDVIFVPEGPEYEHMGLHDWGDEPKRRLIRNWDMIESEKRNNKGRVTLRRYLALMANKTLRKKVFENCSKSGN